MEPIPRHQCFIYQGAPSLTLPMFAESIRQKLGQNYRCLYLNSPPMVAGMRSYLAAAGVDVKAVTAKGSLMMSSERHHLADGKWFDVDMMMQALEGALAAALRDGYAGLWASGDMSWEFGPETGHTKLLEYEWRLEELFQLHPQLQGVCQYHVNTLPEVTASEALLSHPSIYVNQTLSLVNPNYVRPENFEDEARDSPQLAGFLSGMLESKAS